MHIAFKSVGSLVGCSKWRSDYATAGLRGMFPHRKYVGRGWTNAIGTWNMSNSSVCLLLCQKKKYQSNSLRYFSSTCAVFIFSLCVLYISRDGRREHEICLFFLQKTHRFTLNAQHRQILQVSKFFFSLLVPSCITTHRIEHKERKKWRMLKIRIFDCDEWQNKIFLFCDYLENSFHTFKYKWVISRDLP